MTRKGTARRAPTHPAAMIEFICERIVQTTNAATAVNLDTDDVDPGEVALITYASLFNESGEAVTVEFLVMRGAQEFQLGPSNVVQTEDAGETLPWLVLGVGEFFRAVVTGTANKGKVTLLVSGFKLTLGDLAARDIAGAATAAAQAAS